VKSDPPPKLISWTGDLSVGISSIDAQHQRLVALTNDLHAAIVSGRGAAVVARTLVGLLAYTVSHFAHEEKLLRESGYPAFEQHHAEHQRLVNSIKELQRDLTAGKPALSVDVRHFLKNWLRTHICGTDQKYSAHLQAAGVK